MPEATLIDGNDLAARWRADIAVQVEALSVPLHMAALCGGDDAPSRAFLKLKARAAQDAGITFSTYRFEADDESGMRSTLQFLAADDEVHGILVQLPLPEGWDTDALVGSIPPGKDVDALTGKGPVVAPAALAVARALEEYRVQVSGRRAAVIGEGRLVGRPVAAWLREHGATVDVIDIHTLAPAAIAAQADLVVCGAGVPGLVTSEWVREGAVVLDFGSTDGKGDVEAESVKKRAGLLSPVPGGMGPLVVAAVLQNLVDIVLNNPSG